MTQRRITHRLAATALATALFALGAAPAMAQTPPPPPAGAQADAPARHAHGPRGQHMSPEQRQQRMAQRQAAFKQKLQITAEQEGAWKTFTDAMQPQPGAHARLDRKGMAKLSTPERIDRMRALRNQRAAEMDRRGDAVKALYAVLTPEQQKTFDAAGARMHHGKKGHRHQQRGHGMHHPHHGA